MILCCRDCPALYKMLSIISGFYPLDASSTSLVMTTKNISRHCCITPRDKFIQLRTTELSSFLVFCEAALSF